MVKAGEEPGVVMGLRMGFGMRGRVYYGFERGLVDAA